MSDPATVLTWRASPDLLNGLVAGFAERRDGQMRGAAYELPLALPLLQFILSGEYEVAGAPAPVAGLWGPCSHVRPAQAHGPLHVFVVILTLRGARLLARTSLSALVERIVEIGAVRPEWGALRDRLADAADFQGRVQTMEAELRRVFAGTSASPTLALADEVANHRLRGSVATVSRLSGIGARALQKRFLTEIGWSPKRLMRVARLQRVLRMLHPLSWGAPMDDAFLEYTDEAHLARDFRALTGLSPAAYVREKRRSGDPLLHTILAG